MLDERQMPAMNWMMQKLYPHVGHHIVCVTYGCRAVLLIPACHISSK